MCRGVGTAAGLPDYCVSVGEIISKGSVHEQPFCTESCFVWKDWSVRRYALCAMALNFFQVSNFSHPAHLQNYCGGQVAAVLDYPVAPLGKPHA